MIVIKKYIIIKKNKIDANNIVTDANFVNTGKNFSCPADFEWTSDDFIPIIFDFGNS